MVAVPTSTTVRPVSPTNLGRRSSTPTTTVKMNGANGFSSNTMVPRLPHSSTNGYVPSSVLNYSAAAGSGPTAPPPPPPHYFNNLPGIGYNSASLAHLHQYLVAAHLAHPLRNVSLPLQQNPLDPDGSGTAAERDHKRKRSDSGIEDSSKFINEAKMARYQQHETGHQSPAEMETVKKILETVNANVTRQLLEASVQRVKNAAHHQQQQEQQQHSSSLSSSPMEKAELSEGTCNDNCLMDDDVCVPSPRLTQDGLLIITGLAAKLEEESRNVPVVSPNVTPGLEDMMEEVPDTDDQQQPANRDEEGAGDEEMMMMREDAASDTGTDDSGLVMALDQDSINGHRDDHHHHPSNNNNGSNQAGSQGMAGGSASKTSERTRSTISEDKAAVSYHNKNNFCLLYF